MTSFRVWAPDAKTVSVVVAGRDGRDDVHEMSRHAGGWWATDVPTAEHGTDYAFRLDGSHEELPDPRSAWQPCGVHGRSRVLDHGRFEWADGLYRGLVLTGSVFYELHVGTFTPEGTFDAAIGKLDHLVALGVDAVELLPCAAFPGEHGWGYDGVDLYAVHEPYGGPDGLKRFVDAAHARGIGVVMDVVYNHLGPDGNYLSRFGPYFTGIHHTPWGDAVNLDAPGSDEVRAFLVDNARMWLRDYHCDGLRLDAVHALVDERAVHLLEELAVAAEGTAALERRPLFLIAESDRNNPRVVLRREAGGYGLDAQWCDDVHHAIWATLSGEQQGYYGDFGSLPTLAKALTSVFVHDGTYSSFRGRSHGRPVPPDIATYRFVTYLQNHDQVGNRMVGDRASQVLPDGLLRVGAALVLTSPYTPMLFMGEEWGARTPWQFFSDHESPELAAAVVQGRREEFAAHGWGAERVPDPQSLQTMEASRLDWSEPTREPHASLLEWHRRLLALRRTLPELTDPRRSSVRCAYDESARWFVMRRGRVAVVCNLAAERQAVPVDGAPYDVLLASTEGFAFAQGEVEFDGESVVIALLL